MGRLGVRHMNGRTVIQQVLLWFLLGSASACTVADHMSPSGDSPFFTVDSAQIKVLKALSQKQDRLLKNCPKRSSCDELLYARGMTMMFESHAGASTIFQEVVSSAPQSQYANRSIQWLRLLREGKSSHPAHGLLAQYVARELLDREVRTSRSRTSSQDKRVKELTRQLEMLKQIDQERQVNDLPLLRLSPKGPPQ
jgi:hypothetical protein